MPFLLVSLNKDSESAPSYREGKHTPGHPDQQDATDNSQTEHRAYFTILLDEHNCFILHNEHTVIYTYTQPRLYKPPVKAKLESKARR